MHQTPNLILVTLSGHCAPETPNLILHSSHIIRTLCTWDTQPDTPFKSHYQDTVHLRHPTWYSIQVTLSGHCAPETPNLILHSSHIIRTLCTWDTQPDTPFKSHYQDTVHPRHPTWYAIQDTLSGHGAPETPNLILLSSHIIRTLCTGDTQPDTPLKTHYQDTVHLRHPTWYSGDTQPDTPLDTLSGHCAPETTNRILHSSHIIRTLCTRGTQPDTPLKTHYQDTVHRRHPNWHFIQVILSGHCAPETPNLTLHSSHIIRHCAPETPNLILHSRHIIRTLCTWDTQPDTPFMSHCQDTVRLRHPTWYSIQDKLSGHCAPETPNLILHSSHIIRTLCTRDTQPDTPFKTHYQYTVHQRHPTWYSIQVTLSGHCAHENPTWYSNQDTLSGQCAPETPNLILHSRHIIRTLHPRHPTWYSIQVTLSGH